MVNPSICKQCASIIIPKEGEKIKAVRVRSFCNRSCAAQFNNAKHPKKKSTAETSGLCQTCGNTVEFKRRKNGNYFPRSFCDGCLRDAKAARFGVELIDARTKGELFNQRKNYQSARSAIRQHAVAVYVATGKSLACAVCGYDKHAPICHIRAVSDFPDDTTIAQINAPENLVALCPNHHWELDNGLLSLPSFQSSNEK